MTDPIRELKSRAELLQRELRRGNPAAAARLRALPEFRRRPEGALVAAGMRILRRECLALLAVELGFSGWPHAKAVLSGRGPVEDFGTLLYPRRCGFHLNLWYRSYPEAAVVRRASGGYLLAYRRHFMVVERPFIETLGLDGHDEEWRRLGFDWVLPADVEARRRLYGALIAQLPREVS